MARKRGFVRLETEWSSSWFLCPVFLGLFVLVVVLLVVVLV